MAEGLLLIHAFPLDARMWDAQLAAFDTVGVPVVAPHLPGFGGTGSAGDTMTMASAAQRCIDELDRAGVGRAVVCGLSMGGYVTFELWRRAPERFTGLILANTKSGPDSEEAGAGRRRLAERLREEGNVFLAENPPPLLSEAAPEELRARVRSLIAEQPAGSIAAAALGMAERPDSTSDLPGIDVPALVVTSSADALIPPEVTSPMAEQIPGADLVIIQGAGHLSNLEAPGEFNDLLEAHLRRSGIV